MLFFNSSFFFLAGSSSYIPPSWSSIKNIKFKKFNYWKVPFFYPLPIFLSFYLHGDQRECGLCRVVQVILEQNHDKEHPFLEKFIRFYAPYWFSISRCPPLTFHLVDRSGKKHSRKIYQRSRSKTNTDIFEEITEEEIHEGYTIASALNFNSLGLSVSINQTGKNQFGTVEDLSPLGDMVRISNFGSILFLKRSSNSSLI